jgi:hypothetical protein
MLHPQMSRPQKLLPKCQCVTGELHENDQERSKTDASRANSQKVTHRDAGVQSMNASGRIGRRQYPPRRRYNKPKRSRQNFLQPQVLPPTRIVSNCCRRVIFGCIGSLILITQGSPPKSPNFYLN